MTHLSRTGALTYSEAVGRLLRERPVGRPWVTLPRYDPKAAEALASSSDVEDVVTSGRELTRVMAEVRQSREARGLAHGAGQAGGRR